MRHSSFADVSATEASQVRGGCLPCIVIIAAALVLTISEDTSTNDTVSSDPYYGGGLEDYPN